MREKTYFACFVWHLLHFGSVMSMVTLERHQFNITAAMKTVGEHWCNGGQLFLKIG